MSVTFGNQNTPDIKNEIVLSNDGSVGDNHFKIRFCPYMNKYFIKDLGQGHGTLLKVDAPMELQSGSVICIGHSYITVGILFKELNLDVLASP